MARGSLRGRSTGSWKALPVSEHDVPTELPWSRILTLDLLHLCEDLGVQVLGLARNVPEAVSDLPPLQPDALVTDMHLDGKGDGVDVACEMRKHTPDLRVVFVTGTTKPGELARISATKPHRILSKPVSEAELRDALA